MEDWSNGRMELINKWNTGILEKWKIVKKPDKGMMK